MPEFDHEIEIMVDGADQVVAIKPPVDVPFRERMYEILDEMGLIKEIAIREGSFFETQHLPHGEPYSALRVASTALQLTDPHQSIGRIARRSVEVLEEQGKTADFRPYLLTPGGSRKLFEKETPDSRA